MQMEDSHLTGLCLTQELEGVSFEGIGTLRGTGIFNGTGQFTGIGSFSGEMVNPDPSIKQIGSVNTMFMLT